MSTPIIGLFALAALTLSASIGHAADLVPPMIATSPTADRMAPADPAYAELQSEGDAPVDEAALDCMAKVVLHEANGQPRDGQIAVAQTIVNRLSTGRNGASVCAVVNQPGQFFSTASYNPNRDGQGWATAVEVARAVLSGSAGDMAQGAMFFRAARYPPTSFFRTRPRVAAIGGHVFYR